jgi:hypothetical protein
MLNMKESSLSNRCHNLYNRKNKKCDKNLFDWQTNRFLLFLNWLMSGVLRLLSGESLATLCNKLLAFSLELDSLTIFYKLSEVYNKEED